MRMECDMTDSTNAKLRELRERVADRARSYRDFHKRSTKASAIYHWSGAVIATEAILPLIDAMIQEAGE